MKIVLIVLLCYIVLGFIANIVLAIGGNLLALFAAIACMFSIVLISAILIERVEI